MKRFRFSLEAVMTLRRGQHEQALEALGRASRRHQEAIGAWRDALAEFEKHLELRRSRSDASGPDRLRDHEWQTLLEGRLEARRQDVEKEQRALMQQHEALALARQALEIIEKVRDRRRTHHQEEALKEEQKLLDEMGLRSVMAQGLLRGQDESVLHS